MSSHLSCLAELAGLVEHCDFYEQESLSAAESTMRPDMVIRMPDQRDIVVDAKTPLDAYLSATEQRNEAERKNHLTRHARQVRNRVKELSKKPTGHNLKKHARLCRSIYTR